MGTGRSIIFPHGIALLAALLMSEALLMALTRFGPIQGAIAALVLPLPVAAIAVPDKARKLLWLTILAVPILIFNVPPRRLGLTVGDVLIGASALVVAVEKALATDRSWKWQGTIFTGPLFALLLAALISVLASADSQLAISDIFENVRYLLFYLVFMSLVRSVDDFKWACHLLLAGCVPSVLLGLAQYFLGVGLEISDGALPNTSFVAEGVDVVRIYGTFRESLAFAQYLLVPLCLAIGLLSYSRRVITSIMLVGFVGLGIIALALSLSRGASADFVIVLILFFWLRVPKGVLSYIAVWPAVTVVAVIGYWDVLQSLVPESVAARLAGLGDDYYVGRGYVWQAALAITADHPIFGIGPRNLYHVLPNYAPTILADPVWRDSMEVTSPLAGFTGYTSRFHVDNFYLTLLPEIGVVGMIPLALLVFRAIAQACRNYRGAPADLKPYALGVMGALVALLLNMATTYGYSDIRLALLIWLLLAMTVVLQRLVEVHAAA
jgi:O-antigen ligase